MEALTLRKIPPPVARSIRRRAAEKRISLNRAVLELLEEAVGGRRKSDTAHGDLEELFGAWSKAEGAAFSRSLKSRRRVDPELWR